MKLLKTYDWQVPKGVIAFGPGMSLAIGSPDSQHKHLEPARWVKACWTSGERWFGCPVSEPFLTEAEALAELDRIAALISGTAPAQGWVKGAPPHREGWWLIIDFHGNPAAVQWVPEHQYGPWVCASGDTYTDVAIHHHQPTPIEAPKENV